MTIKIRLTHHGMDGEGATVKEAKVDAGRKSPTIRVPVGVIG